MAIELRVEPRKVVTWEQFSKDYPPFSIALDGYCSGPTRSSIGGRRLNLNHHEGEDPIAVLVRTLNDLLQPQGWTSGLREATRELIAHAQNAPLLLKDLSSLTPLALPEDDLAVPDPYRQQAEINASVAQELRRTTEALEQLSPLLAVLGSDASTRFRLPISGDDASRMAIRSTTDQALCQVKLGLYDTYQVNGEPTALLWINDFDEDVEIATYILRHPEAVDNKLFRELVKLEDYLDMSAGLFPVKKRWHVVRRLCWITQPYTDAKLSGELFTMDAKTMEQRLLETHGRIDRTISGDGGEIEPDTRYEVISKHGFWKVIREIGAHARLGLADNGIKAFISVRSEVPGHYRYTLARLSKFIPFPLVAFAERMNELEGIGPENPDRWGGSDTVIGPPRLAGTRYSPAELTAVMVAFLKEHDLHRPQLT
jgi:hypothetical protein